MSWRYLIFRLQNVYPEIIGVKLSLSLFDKVTVWRRLESKFMERSLWLRLGWSKSFFGCIFCQSLFWPWQPKRIAGLIRVHWHLTSIFLLNYLLYDQLKHTKFKRPFNQNFVFNVDQDKKLEIKFNRSIIDLILIHRIFGRLRLLLFIPLFKVLSWLIVVVAVVIWLIKSVVISEISALAFSLLSFSWVSIIVESIFTILIASIFKISVVAIISVFVLISIVVSKLSETISSSSILIVSSFVSLIVSVVKLSTFVRASDWSLVFFMSTAVFSAHSATCYRTVTSTFFLCLLNLFILLINFFQYIL